jgi:acetylornithine deacetylase/succinyl-diaminopimelate desuccinylase-like protein
LLSIVRLAVRETIGRELTARFGELGCQVTQDAVGNLLAVLPGALGLNLVSRKSGGGTDGNFFNAKGIPCVAMSTGMVDEHATTEHIGIEDMVNACKVLVTILTQDPEAS